MVYSQDIPKELDPVESGSYLTACSWIENDALRIRVYYQRQDEYIRETAFNNGKGWGKGVFTSISHSAGLEWYLIGHCPVPEHEPLGSKIILPEYRREIDVFWSQTRRYLRWQWQNQDRWFSPSISGNRHSISTNFPQTATVNHGSIPDGTHLTAVLNTSDDMTLRIYFIRDGNLVEIRWSEKGG